MANPIAPWLDGLNEGWEQQAPSHNHAHPAPVSGTNSLRSSRIPRRNASGLSSSVSSIANRKPSSTTTRKPLAPLDNGTVRSSRPAVGTTKQTISRSVSETSTGSVVHTGTVQMQGRSKSESPGKKQETLEWKKRLLHGKLGYGDQTDLFGPSALENIFNRSEPVENNAPKSKPRVGWLQQSSDQSMPSSPPPWPASREGTMPVTKSSDHGLSSVREDDQDNEDLQNSEIDASHESEPFDLQCTTDDGEQQGSDEPDSESLMVKNGGQSLHSDSVGQRTISGRTELEQEDFSPVFVSKHTNPNGQVGYAAYDPRKAVPSTNTKSKDDDEEEHESEGHRRQEALAPDTAADDSVYTDGAEIDSVRLQPDLSLSENLETGTPPVSGLSRHVQLKRGGYSAYGSFKNRPLSHCTSRPSDSFQDQQQSEASLALQFDPKELPRAPTPPPAPSTPVRGANTDPPKSKSSGSPLKLFGPHDTFTNRRLLRRMSQLDPDVEAGSDEAEHVSHPISSDDVGNSSFGSGELDGHEFHAEITITSASDSDGANSECSPGSEVPVPGSRDPSHFKFDPVPEAANTYKVKRKLSKHSTATSAGSAARISNVTTTVFQQSIRKLKADSTTILQNGKRLPNSPAKDPTPKRRRTLHESELEDARDVNQSFQANLSEASLNRKRKDSRHGGTQNSADPNTLAQRKILRPRNPTPNQDREKQVRAEVRQATEEYVAHHKSQLDDVLEQVETSMSSDSLASIQEQAEAVASEVAAFTLKVSKPSAEHGERKPSITTQDFVSEAMTIMAMIRANARPKSALRNVEEADTEQSSPVQNTGDDNHHLELSRPPSREGRVSGWRRPLQPPTDARVISHLRKFEERDDTEFIGESIPSLRVATEEVFEDSVVVIDEHSNIRITKPPVKPQQSDPRPDSQRSQGSTQQSYRSDGTSTGRTNATTSTRKSENVGTLAPNAVAHIIPELVGTMMFDKEKQTWVRAKSPRKGDFLEPPSQLSSDEDPFREISDLAVDHQAELRRISATNIPSLKPDHGEPIRATSAPEQRPVTRDSSFPRQDYSSSVPSRYSAFGSSQQEKVETRATSYSDEELARMAKSRQQTLNYAAVQAALAIRNEQQTIPEEADSQDLNESALEESDLVSGDSLVHNGAEEDLVDYEIPQRPQSSPVRPAVATMPRRRMSLRRQTLTNTINAMDGREQSELSLIAALPGERLMNLSLSVSRPLSKKTAQDRAQELAPSPCKTDQSFLLSELPEFTVHEEDHERPSEKVLAARLAQHAADEVNDRYALAVKDLVKTLTDVKESEPYWEDVKQLDMQGRSLDTLYGLDDFCTRVQSMDVSNNSLRHLEGTPYCVRRLSARANHLTSLTAWNHLSNLQYLDISGNQLTSLAGLGDLFHLRELIADDNAVTSLNGIAELDALLKLRVRRNAIQQVDFSSSQLHQLKQLDLCGNQIKHVVGLDTLSSLEVLKLDDNLLHANFELPQKMPNPRELSLKNCGLATLDVRNCPNLRILMIDGNRLRNVFGLDTLTGLDLLSMREQKLPKGVEVGIFDNCIEAKTIRLSGNTISSLRFSTSFLNLQHLELASTGLQALPDDFGLNVPNLRSLNLNFNFLKDIRPVLNVQKIERLSVCGNRLDRLRKSIATLAKMTTLTALDLRDNPITQGFYAPAITAQTSVVRRERHPSPSSTVDEDEREESLEQARHNLPNGDVDQDSAHQGRMDESTKLRRRVYELLLANSCRGLRALDGLGFDRGSAAQKDGVFWRLVELGIVRKAEGEGRRLE